MSEMEFRYCHSSRVVKKNCVYNWKINNFNLIPIIGGHYLHSKPFNFPRKYYHTWQICLSKGSHAAQECNLKDFFEILHQLKCNSKKLAESVSRAKPDVSKILEDSFEKLKSAINNLDSKEVMNGSDPEEYDVPDIVKRLSSNFKNLVDAEFLQSSEGKTISKTFKKVESDSETIDELVQKMDSEEKSFNYEKSSEGISDVEKSIEISLKRMEDPDTYDYVTYSISLKAEDGTILKCFENRQLDVSKHFYYRIKEEQFGGKNWFEEKNVVVICEIQVLYLANDELELFSEEEQLSFDLQNLFLDGSSSDFSLIAGSAKFPVHKFVLASRSVGFAELLKDGSKLNLPLEFGEDVVRQLVQYMYTGKLREDLSVELYSELLKVALKYDVDFLDKRCRGMLEKLAKMPVCDMCSIPK